MAVVKITDLDDRVQDWLEKYWDEKGTADHVKVRYAIVDTDLVFETMEKVNPLLFDQIKNPKKYIFSRWELLDI